MSAEERGDPAGRKELKVVVPPTSDDESEVEEETGGIALGSEGQLYQAIPLA